MDVFNFALSTVPKSIKEVTEFSGATLENVDYLVLHQANKFMTDFIVKKLKFDNTKVPYCLDQFGNTSSASIPLTICSELSGKLNNKNITMCGFGAGLSWGSASINYTANISHLIEY